MRMGIINGGDARAHTMGFVKFPPFDSAQGRFSRKGREKWGTRSRDVYGLAGSDRQRKSSAALDGQPGAAVPT
jgi:hypothetical protein